MEFDIDKTLNELREEINKRRNIEERLTADSDHLYRFLFPSISEEEKETRGFKPESFLIVQEKYERRYIVHEHLNENNIISLFNMRGDDNPDMLGLLTHSWKSGDVWVGCRNNNKDIAFAPFMMEHVMVSTKEHGIMHYGNVCICCPNTEIDFEVFSNCTSGMYATLKLDTEDKGYEVGGYRLKEEPNHSKEMGISYGTWDDGTAIVIKDPKKDPYFDMSKLLGYQQMMITVTDIEAFASGSFGPLSVSEFSASDSQTGIVGGRGIGSGILGKGEFRYKGEVADFTLKYGKVLGVIRIWFFIFKTKADAEKAIRMNAPVRTLYK